MANKKISMTHAKVSLFNEMKKLAKRANQRMLRLERLTGMTGSFATKQLYDYLDNGVLQAITPKGRVAVKKSYSIDDMNSIIKALKDFMNDVSTTPQVRKLTKEYSERIGKPIDIERANTIYQIDTNYKWIYEYYDSDFWDIARESVVKNWSLDDWLDKIPANASKEMVIDEEMRVKLENLYTYTRDTKI